MKLNNSGTVLELLKDLSAITSKLSRRRKNQLYILFILLIIGAASEVVSIGAIVPFLTALSRADTLLAHPSIKPWLDLIEVNSAPELITLMAALFALSIVFANFMRVLILWVQTRFTAAIASDFSTEIFRRILFQPYLFHTNLNSGITVSLITNDLGKMMSVLRHLLKMLTQVLIVISILIGLVIYNASVALTMAALIACVYIIISRVSQYYLWRNGKISSNKHIFMLKVMQDSFGGIRDIILGGTQQTFIETYSDADTKMRHANSNNTVLLSIPRSVIEVTGVTILCGFTSLFVWQEKNLQEILPLIGGFSMAAIRLIPAIQTIYTTYGGMQGAHVSMKRALIALERSMDPTYFENNNNNFVLEKNILLENIWFSYSSIINKDTHDDWTLKDINIEIPVNSTIALVGDTGGGKSTLANIILGLLYPQRGCMRVNGEIITEKNLDCWRHSIAHVAQSIFLSDNTIKNNIAFGIPDDLIDFNRVREAARMACINDFIESRPLAYDEIVGEQGIRLSGGQRQRIGIARALYKNTSVIVFDEATSSLDNTTEAEVMEAINNLSGKVTLILIAHRLTTIRSADKIYEIRNGCVNESGTYEELVKKSNSFQAMAKAIT